MTTRRATAKAKACPGQFRVASFEWQRQRQKQIPFGDDKQKGKGNSKCEGKGLRGAQPFFDLYI